MVEVRITAPAYEDLVDIETFIAENSPSNARKLINKIFERMAVLKTFPEVGRMVSEYENPNIRQLSEGNYRIIYQIETDELVVILRIIQHKRLLEP